ncbi:Cytoplasmic 60S subunit biogenesis factor [Diplonema papillatum]|nr:Cytoplasmic 60S subunit biogenesis factor [Diplonema papillatum]
MQQYSCNTCGVVCADREALRRHYDGDLHADNVKRRVSGLVPLTAQAHGVRSRCATSMQSLSYKCTICDKRFASPQTLNSHVQSQKHKELKAKRKLAKESEEGASAATASVVDESTIDAEDTKDDDDDLPLEEESWEQYAPRVPESEDLDQTDCVFCNIRAPTLEDLLCHMAKAHNFTFPLQHLIVDIQDLVDSLISKVNTGVCLVCGEEGRAFETRLGVQDHMTAKGHQMLKLSTGDYNAHYSKLPEFKTPGGPEGDCPIEYQLPNGKKVFSKNEIKMREAAPLDKDGEVQPRLLAETTRHQVQSMPRYEQLLTNMERKKEKRARKQHTYEQQKQKMRFGVHNNCQHGKGYQGDYVGKTL